MKIDPQQAQAKDLYFRMISFIVPRPIAWVSTLSTEGVRNIAPFSFFNGVTSRPPTLLFCAGNKRDGSPKDTVKNLLETKECVVHVVSHDLVEAMVKTSVAAPADLDEFQWAEVPHCPSEKVNAPRVPDAPVAIECRLFDHLEVCDDNGDVTSRVLILRMELIHLADDILDSGGRIVAEKLDAISRLGGQQYGRLGPLFEMPRPPRWVSVEES